MTSDLSGVHTRVLLRALQESSSGYGSRWYEALGNGLFDFGFAITTRDELKAELAKREHVPNKSEAKKIRQDKARVKKHR